ncbi:Amine oxidase [flavin-containing] A (Monoamine oxidase type A) (MAO-A), partial [Durusdinium trenchii]
MAFAAREDSKALGSGFVLVPGPAADDCDTLVLCCGFAGSVDKQVSKYAQLFHGMGFATLRGTLPRSAMMSSRMGISAKGLEVVSALLEDLEELVAQGYKRLVVFIMSNGGCFVLRLMMIFWEKGEHTVVAESVVAAIFDSAPANTSVRRFLMAMSNGKRRPVLEALMCPLEGSMRRAGDKFVHDMKVNPFLTVPELYIASHADLIVPYTDGGVKEVADYREKELGLKIDRLIFDETPHVQHFRFKPVEYKAKLVDFLTKGGGRLTTWNCVSNLVDAMRNRTHSWTPRGGGERRRSAEMETVDVVIVGGGPSGLSAARFLHEQGDGAGGVDGAGDAATSSKVVVLEARERVGGRTFTLETEHGSFVDGGGAYVGPGQDHLLELADKVGVETFEVFAKGKVVFINKDGSVKTGTVETPPMAVWELLDYNNALIKFDDLVVREFPGNNFDAWSTKKAAARDGETMAQWINANCSTERVRRDFGAVVSVLLCKPPEEISVLYFCWYCRSSENLRRLTDIGAPGAQERKFKGGSQGLSDRLVSQLLPRDTVRLGHAVNRVEQREADVLVTCRNGATFAAKRVIMASPIPLFKRDIDFVPPLPKEKTMLYESMSFGSIIKTNMHFATPFWRDKGLNGQVLSGKADDPILFSFDDCKPDGSDFSIMGFCLADRSRNWGQKTKEERKEAIVAQYVCAFGEEARNPVAYSEVNWDAEEFTGGCYVGTPEVGKFAEFGHMLREPHGLVHFAGTETARVWPGYINGAIEAGYRAAAEVLSELTGKPVMPPTPPRMLAVKPNAPKVLERFLAIVWNSLQAVKGEESTGLVGKNLLPKPCLLSATGSVSAEMWHGAFGLLFWSLDLSPGHFTVTQPSETVSQYEELDVWTPAPFFCMIAQVLHTRFADAIDPPSHFGSIVLLILEDGRHRGVDDVLYLFRDECRLQCN